MRGLAAVAASALVLLVSGCIPPPSAPPVAPPPRTAPPPVVAPVPVAPPVATPRTATPGVWSYSRDARGSIARFGLAGSDARFTLRCDLPARRIFASVANATGGTLVIRASTAMKGFTAVPTGNGAYVAAEIAATDSVLDAAAFSRGRFSVELGGSVLVLPAWPEFARVVEDCRR